MKSAGINVVLANDNFSEALGREAGRRRQALRGPACVVGASVVRAGGCRRNGLHGCSVKVVGKRSDR